MFYLNNSKFNLKEENQPKYCKKKQVCSHINFEWSELGDKHSWVKILASSLTAYVYICPKKHLNQI